MGGRVSVAKQSETSQDELLEGKGGKKRRKSGVWTKDRRGSAVEQRNEQKELERAERQNEV